MWEEMVEEGGTNKEFILYLKLFFFVSGSAQKSVLRDLDPGVVLYWKLSPPEFHHRVRRSYWPCSGESGAEVQDPGALEHEDKNKQN